MLSIVDVQNIPNLYICWIVPSALGHDCTLKNHFYRSVFCFVYSKQGKPTDSDEEKEAVRAVMVCVF